MAELLSLLANQQQRSPSPTRTQAAYLHKPRLTGDFGLCPVGEVVDSQRVRKILLIVLLDAGVVSEEDGLSGTVFFFDGVVLVELLYVVFEGVANSDTHENHLQ